MIYLKMYKLDITCFVVKSFICKFTKLYVVTWGHVNTTENIMFFILKYHSLVVILEPDTIIFKPTDSILQCGINERDQINLLNVSLL